MLNFLFAFTVQLSAPTPAGDAWLAADKLKHFFTAAFVQSVSYSAVRSMGADHRTSLVAASGVTLGAAVGKELWDAAGHGTPSARDLVWDVAGAAAASALLERTVR